jgi:hypothetical protein
MSTSHGEMMLTRENQRSQRKTQGRGVHVTGVSAAYTFKLNKNILSE